MSYVRCKVIGEAPVIGADGWQYEKGEEVVLDDTKTKIEFGAGINWEVLETLPEGYKLVPPTEAAPAGKPATKAN